MSLEKELDSVLSEALPPRRDPPARLAPQTAKPAAKPTSPQKKNNSDFASVRKAMRKPMVNADAQIHKIDQFLNVTQKDPSQLGSTVDQMEKSFDGLLEPLKQVRSGVRQLKQAADEFGADYVGDKPKGLPEMQPGQDQPQRRVGDLAAKRGITKSPTVAGVRRGPEGDNEDRLMNRVATDVEMVNKEQDRLAAANKGWEEYQQSGGKMNRGEFIRHLVKRLRLPTEDQPQESSVQRRKLV